MSVSGRIKRIQAELAWRTSRGANQEWGLLFADQFVDVKQITAGETSGLGTGAVVWDCAVVLAKYLAKHKEDYMVDSIIEVGSGNGWLGIVAALLWPSTEITLTDQAPLIPLMEENVERNEQKFEILTEERKIEIKELNWGCESIDMITELVQDKKKQEVLIIASDCVFQNCPVLLLLETFEIMLDVLPNARVIMSVEHRSHDNEVLFFDKAKHTLCIDTIPKQDLDPAYTAEDIDVYVFSKKP